MFSTGTFNIRNTEDNHSDSQVWKYYKYGVEILKGELRGKIKDVKRANIVLSTALTLWSRNFLLNFSTLCI